MKSFIYVFIIIYIITNNSLAIRSDYDEPDNLSCVYDNSCTNETSQSTDDVTTKFSKYLGPSTSSTTQSSITESSWRKSIFKRKQKNHSKIKKFEFCECDLTVSKIF